MKRKNDFPNFNILFNDNPLHFHFFMRKKNYLFKNRRKKCFRIDGRRLWTRLWENFCVRPSPNEWEGISCVFHSLKFEEELSKLTKKIRCVATPPTAIKQFIIIEWNFNEGRIIISRASFTFQIGALIVAAISARKSNFHLKVNDRVQISMLTRIVSLSDGNSFIFGTEMKREHKFEKVVTRKLRLLKKPNISWLERIGDENWRWPVLSSRC